jgi:site-specific DNA recombinase
VNPVEEGDEYRACQYGQFSVFLTTRTWTTPGAVEARVRAIPRHEELAAKVAELWARGASIEAIAGALGEPWQIVKDALAFAQSGIRPVTKHPGRRTGERTGPPSYQRIALEVVRLRDREHRAFGKIAQALGVSVSTVRRAYDHLRPEAAERAAGDGTRPQRGFFRRLTPEVVGRVRAVLAEGRSAADIAEAVGCGLSSVHRECRRAGTQGHA